MEMYLQSLWIIFIKDIIRIRIFTIWQYHHINIRVLFQKFHISFIKITRYEIITIDK